MFTQNQVTLHSMGLVWIFGISALILNEQFHWNEGPRNFRDKKGKKQIFDKSKNQI